VLLLLLLFALSDEPRGAAHQPERSGGIVLRHVTDEGELYEGEEDQTTDQSVEEPSSDEVPEKVLAALPAADAQSELTDALPDVPPIGPGSRPGGGVGDALEATGGAAQPRSARGGRARVRFYDLEGEGSRFVYVLDRSESMSGRPLASAKRQLIASLQPLESTHQFQIIFFNHRLQIFDLTGGQHRVAFATDENKANAAKFVDSITADGGTETASALSAAVAMRPDVIFLLTDAEDALSAAQLDAIVRKNNGRASINVVEFGFGPASGNSQHLVSLARQNGGRYVYVDTAGLADRR